MKIAQFEEAKRLVDARKDFIMALNDAESRFKTPRCREAVATLAAGRGDADGLMSRAILDAVKGAYLRQIEAIESVLKTMGVEV